MAFKLGLTQLGRCTQKYGIRNLSSSSSFVDVSVDDKTGISTVTMQRQPVNSLNLELLTELSSTFTALENNKSRGMILTSASNSVFSAGLDIMEMYKPDLDRAKNFWTMLQETWLKLCGSQYPTVAVINGHSPAGGCLLAMSCEYRIMLNNFTIGLNETKLGIAAPSWFMATMCNTINKRDAELALITGRLFSTEEALKVGLIDEVAVDKNDGMSKAQKFLKQFVGIPPMARVYTKTLLRKEMLQALEDNREQDVESFLFMMQQPKVQKSLEFYLEGLKKKSSKA